jgi:hypothetical protein
VIARREMLDFRAAFHDDAGRLMAEHCRELPGHVAGEDVQIGMAQTGRFDLHEHFAGARAVEIDGFDREGFVRCVGDGSAYFQWV